MSNYERDPLLPLTFRLLHDLMGGTNALHQTVKHKLLFEALDRTEGATRHNPQLKDASFYKDLEWHISEGRLHPAQTAQALNLILREVELFRIMVQNFYGAMTRDQPLILNRKPVKLDALIQEVIDLFKFSADEREVELRASINGDPVLSIDRELIYRALANVVNNAIKYSYSGVGVSGERLISIDSRRHFVEGEWMISVASQGVGIAAEENLNDYIFEYGTRGRRAADLGQSGTGIGLAETKRIIEAHEGSIKIASRELTTDTYLTTVKIVLPTRH